MILCIDLPRRNLNKPSFVGGTMSVNILFVPEWQDCKVRFLAYIMYFKWNSKYNYL